ncbi:pentapeptide repeat-containing protein [Paenibacillus sp. YPG26]|uniref:pentapeptide repeat-containing protein n=1 Tax=Paenibacillus sp. YPG26 TaxID=2878915 RepID=UPI00203A60C9|nr:pentapeptide repeat-containing protein [Paenibacillus sp. YPG26]USB33649.1 pentapeptide repeat-containing protein [Paenibacillus sp. YPG26]
MLESHYHSDSSSVKSPRHLQADCENCFGLCCTALPFAASVDFAVDKPAGQPCHHLQSDFRCGVHNNLRPLGFRGCTVYDCFGAGQQVSQVTYGGRDWRAHPESAKQMYEVFPVMWQLHELLWYLNEALTLEPAREIRDELELALAETEHLTQLTPDSLVQLDVAAHRAKVNILLLRTSELVREEAKLKYKQSQGRPKKGIGRGADLIAAKLKGANLSGANLRGAYLIAADLREADLRGADLIGADLRDTDLRGANLSHSIFLTQAQVNAAKGDAATQLPLSLIHPAHWPSSGK